MIFASGGKELLDLLYVTCAFHHCEIVNKDCFLSGVIYVNHFSMAAIL